MTFRENDVPPEKRSPKQKIPEKVPRKKGPRKNSPGKKFPFKKVPFGPLNPLRHFCQRLFFREFYFPEIFLPGNFFSRGPLVRRLFSDSRIYQRKKFFLLSFSSRFTQYDTKVLSNANDSYWQ